ITGSFDDVDKAREQSLALVNSGTDVLWPILNAAETGVYSAAEDEGVMSIGFYGDVQRIAPKSYIGAPKADPGDLVYEAGSNSALHNGKANALTVADGQLGLSPLPEGTPPEAKKEVEAAVERLRDGKAGI